jgi:thymidylate kinase
MLIIAEGPDGSGKSTLIKNLAHIFNFPIYHSGGPKTTERMYEVLKELETMANSDQTYLVDRVPFISELVYSKAFDRKPVIAIEKLFSYFILPIKIIYCKIDQQTALANMSREFKVHKPAEHLKMVEINHAKIAAEYISLMDVLEDIGIEIFDYDWTIDNNLDNLLPWIGE